MDFFQVWWINFRNKCSEQLAVVKIFALFYFKIAHSVTAYYSCKSPSLINCQIVKSPAKTPKDLMNWLKIVGGYKFYDYLNFNWRESFLYLMIFWSLLFRANKKMLKLRFYGIYLASPTEKFQKNTTNKPKSLNEFALKAVIEKAM